MQRFLEQHPEFTEQLKADPSAERRFNTPLAPGEFRVVATTDWSSVPMSKYHPHYNPHHHATTLARPIMKSPNYGELRGSRAPPLKERGGSSKSGTGIEGWSSGRLAKSAKWMEEQLQRCARKLVSAGRSEKEWARREAKKLRRRLQEIQAVQNRAATTEVTLPVTTPVHHRDAKGEEGGEVAVAHERIADLERQNAALNKEMEAQSARYAELRAKNKRLRQEKAEHQEYIHNIEDQLVAVEDDLRAAEARLKEYDDG